MSNIDLQPTLTGQTLRLRPLVADDFDALYRVASDPEIWAQHPDSERYKRNVFKERFFEGALASGGALVIETVHNGAIAGSSRFYHWCPDSREISVGYTFIQRALWGTGANRELKQLMLEHIFNYANTVWFHVGQENLRSRRAVEKLGAILSHEEARELEGRAFVQLYYRLDASQYST